MSATDTPGILIVGASIAGATVAETLRAEGYDGRITLVGRERHAPYNRPPLSKQVLNGEWSATDAVIHPADALAGLRIDHRPAETALALDTGAKVATRS
jgi:3-phenylpropionate/trans-cinnamate dioxygenase ferredoxin reductase component